MPVSKKVVFFDGVCVFCNRSVQFLIKIDRDCTLRYATQQGKLAKEILGTNALDSASGLIFWSEGMKFHRSQAVVQILLSLRGRYRLLGKFLSCIPTGLLNIFYNLIAQNRYRFFGKREACMIPSESEKSLFVD